MLLRLEEWESTIQKMIIECNHEQNSPDGILKKWRVNLEKEPTLLKPSEIDQIIREVSDRRSNASR